MNYQETLDFLYAQLPMFQRIGAQAYKPSLENTIRLAEALGNPQNQFKSIHVAGTNGKGSSSHLLASICQSNKYKTGLYTSPHLVDFRERIRVDGEMISKDFVQEFVNKHLSIIEEIKPSFFELCVVMAFDYFAKEKVDVAVIEVGMGGRLDSTNIIHPMVSLITNISYDHMQFLGDTLPKIATEKAGIIKEHTPIIISQYQDECADVFKEIARSKSAKIQFASEEITVENLNSADATFIEMLLKSPNNNYHLKCPLQGNYQFKNMKGVIAVIEKLNEIGFNIADDAVYDGVLNVKNQTGLKGRWDIVQKSPMVIADTGHNEDGIREIINQINTLSFQQLHWVWGMVNDKDPDKVFKLLPTQAKYYFCKPNIPRGLDSEECRAKALEYKLLGDSYNSVEEAYLGAIKHANPQDLIIIGGSTFVVADFYNFL